MSVNIIAKVNGHPVTCNDLDAAIQALSMETHRKTMDRLTPEEYRALRDLSIEKLISQQLIFQEALAQGVVATVEQVLAEEERQASSFSTREEFYEKIRSAGIEPPAFQRMLRFDLTVNMMTDREVGSLSEPSREEIEEAFKHHRQRMKTPLCAKVSHILIRVDEEGRKSALKKISELRERAISEDFATLAQEFSQCPSGHLGGDLGYIKKGDMPKSFEAAVISQPVGTVGEPVETQFGLHLVKVFDRQEEKEMTLEEARPVLTDLLKKQTRAQKIHAWVAILKERATIEIF